MAQRRKRSSRRKTGLKSDYGFIVSPPLSAPKAGASVRYVGVQILDPPDDPARLSEWSAKIRRWAKIAAEAGALDLDNRAALEGGVAEA